MIGAPPPSDIDLFIDRFGIEDVIVAFGMTEVPGCIYRLPGEPPVPVGSVGRARPGYELKIVDEHDVEVPIGQNGELVIRNELPWSISAGYCNDDSATAKVWRNGWFHTGDIFRRDAEGCYFIVDRLKDAIRRRGENISTLEVEREVNSFPAVAETACVAVSSEFGGDEEVKVWIVPRSGEAVEFEPLLNYLVERMPHFMVPRYFELIDGLPKTQTMRVQKHVLRASGNSTSTWDRDAHGFRVTKAGLANSNQSVRQKESL